MVSESSTGIVLPWEQSAIRGDEIPDGLDYPDQVLYLNLRTLYAQKRMGIIDRDTAITEKKKLLDEYKVYQFNWSMAEEWTEIIKLTELARAEFRKNPSIENGFRLVEIIEGRKS
jgi:hypothetical protein